MDICPKIVIIAGPNGAGKSTIAPVLLRDELDLRLYVNADQIAARLSGFVPELMAMKAGKDMIKTLRDHEGNKKSFALETTLAGKSHAKFIAKLKDSGYRINLLFIWLQTPELAVQRVRRRVEALGHSIPEEVIRRRYVRGVQNFFSVYQPLADEWGVYDNSAFGDPKLVASGKVAAEPQVFAADIWKAFCEVAQ